jgi:hypothetical protein
MIFCFHLLSIRCSLNGVSANAPKIADQRRKRDERKIINKFAEIEREKASRN